MTLRLIVWIRLGSWVGGFDWRGICRLIGIWLLWVFGVCGYLLSGCLIVIVCIEFCLLLWFNVNSVGMYSFK